MPQKPASADEIAARVALGQRLAALRDNYGRKRGFRMLSIREFAEMLGISTDRLSRYERGLNAPDPFVLGQIRKVTGCSLDALIAGKRPGSMVLIEEMIHDPATMADRIRWVRELKEPSYIEMARVMRILPDVWLDYENGFREPLASTVIEFARRMGVTTGYLYHGRLDGIEEPLKMELLAQHPALADDLSKRSKSKSRARDADSTVHGGRVAQVI